MAAVHLQPPAYPPFDCKAEGKNIRWTKWIRRLEHNVFNGCHIVDPGQKKGLLLMYGGEDLNDIVDAFDPAILEAVDAVAADNDNGIVAVPAQNVFDRLKTALTNHFNPRTNIEFQRYLFKHTIQDMDDIDDLYSELKQLAVTCQFADVNAEVKSQMISGCSLDKVRDKGLSDPDVTLEQLLQFARNIQMTQSHSKRIKEKTVNAVHAKRTFPRKGAEPAHRQPNRPDNKRKKDKVCLNCGGPWPHKGGIKNCPAKGHQ